MANLKLQAVTKSYDGKNQIIKSIDLNVADGEFIVMVVRRAVGNLLYCAW